MALTTNIKVGVTALLTNSGDLGGGKIPLTLSYSKTLSSGTASGQADVTWGDSNTLAASANTDIDLAGTLTGPLGGTVTFAKVKLIMVTADEGNTNNVVLGNAASNGFVGPFGAATHTIAVPPGGTVVLAAPGTAGWTVTAGTGDLLRVANSGAGSTVSYKILVVGTSA
jgi:hypothetical protein